MFQFLCLLLLTISPLYCVSPVGDVVGKITVGYQGWFHAKGDNSPRSTWVHWAGGVPSKNTKDNVENWPDVREYTHTYQTGFANLGNGQPAKLFSSYDDQTIETHMKWMQENGIDTAAIQRFGTDLHDKSELQFRNGIAEKVAKYAQKYGRKFFIMWDISGWKEFTTELSSDYNNHVKNWTKLPAYAHQNGKPVVCVWGYGITDRPGTAAESLASIKYLKSQGLYVIGGTNTRWLTGADGKKGFEEVYKSMDMIQPWAVGRFRLVDGAKNYKQQLKDDFEYCNKHNIDYQPVLFAGYGWSNHNPKSPRNEIPRLHGNFLWQQFVNIRELAIPTGYVAMFDEYDEGTAIAKTAPNKQWAPTDHYFYTLDADGVNLSSDFYLRLVHDGSKMMKKQIPLTQQHPTKHTV